MKILFNTILIILLSSSAMVSQIVDIPDANFKNTLINTLCVDTDGDNVLDDDVDTNNDGEVQLEEAQLVTNLWLHKRSISSLQGIESFKNLEYLNCGFNGLTSLDISQNLNLITLIVLDNQISNLDVSQNLNLESLACGSNGLSAIDVSQNINLNGLSCTGNAIENLDLTQNIALTKLYCANNQISELDLSANPLLDILVCYGNALSNLDLSDNSMLEALWTSHNNLTDIDISQNPNLEVLDVRQNDLSAIDMNGVPNIRLFYAVENELTSLDVSQNTQLEEMNVRENRLTSLQIDNGNNSQLRLMFANGNTDLSCITVENEDQANSTACDPSNDQWWCKDDWTNYSEDCILGVEDDTLTLVNVYPNPVEDQLYITTTSGIIEAVKIFNVTGSFIDMQSHYVNQQLDVSFLADGVYFIKLKIDGINYIQRFIKE